MAGFYPTFTPEDLANEIWKPLPGFEQYYSVSSIGRVRRDLQTGGGIKGRILKMALRSGYPFVTPSVHNVKHNVSIHQAEALAFLGPVPPCEKGRIEVNHIDGCKTNNRIENLEYCTSSENSYHAVRLGLLPSGDNHYLRKHPEKASRGDQHWARRMPERLKRGEAHHGAKLTDDMVREMRRQYVPGKRGTGCLAVSKRYGINRDTADKILKRKTWTHID